MPKLRAFIDHVKGRPGGEPSRGGPAARRPRGA